MSVVKGSKQYSLKVARHRPWVPWLWTLLVLLLLAGAAAAAWYAGYNKGMAQKQRALADVARLTDALNERNRQVDQLEQELANIRLGAQVDRQSSEEVRQEVIALKEQVAALEADNSFYRNLMAPGENDQGLTFGAVEIVDTDLPRQYRFKFVMQQLATNHQLLNGSLEVVIVGRQDGMAVRYFLNDLSPDIDENRIKLRFKYFQNVEGDLTLPEGFDPERIELTARSSGSNSATIEKRFGWLVEET